MDGLNRGTGVGVSTDDGVPGEYGKGEREVGKEGMGVVEGERAERGNELGSEEGMVVESGFEEQRVELKEMWESGRTLEERLKVAGVNHGLRGKRRKKVINLLRG